MKRRTKTVLWSLAALAVAFPVVSTVSVIVIERMQLSRNLALADAARALPLTGQNGTLVVYFSRSGNTELMALEIAKAKGATVIRLEDEAYRIGFMGWLNAMRDARGQTASPQPAIDLTGYDTIYIGAPIWLYSPAPPVWQFVNDNDLSGKRVILFNSLNSKFGQNYIDEFADAVRQRGGVFAKHLYIVRGRMTQQMDVTDFLAETRRLIEGL